MNIKEDRTFGETRNEMASVGGSGLYIQVVSSSCCD